MKKMGIVQEEIKKMESNSNTKFQALETQMKQMQTRITTNQITFENFVAQMNNRLPSEPFANLKDNMSAITLRSGREVHAHLHPSPTHQEETETEVTRRHPG